MNSDFNAVIESLEKVMAKQSDTVRFARLADAYVNIGRIDDAIDLCLKGLQKYPRYVTGRFVLAKGYMAQGNNDDAKRELETVLAINNRYALAWKYYGDLLRNMGQNDESDLSYSELAEIDPLDEDTRAMIEALKQKREFENDSPTISKNHDSFELEEANESDQLTEETNAEHSEDKFSYILDDIFSEEEEEISDIESNVEDDSPAEISDLTGVILPEQKIPEASAPPQEEDITEPEEFLINKLSDPPEEKDAEVQEEVQESQIVDEMPLMEKTEGDKDITENGEDERIVTPTLGEIYSAQGQFAKAISVFEILASKDPDNKAYQEKIAFLKQKLDESE